MLPHSGSKAVLVGRLQDSDIFPTSSSPQYLRHEDPEPIPENFLEQMKDSDPRVIVKILRKLVHNRNLRKKHKEIQTQSYGRKRYGWGLIDDHERLNSGSCLDEDCPFCGGYQFFPLDLDPILGSVAQCTDDTCKDYNNCSKCRKELLKLKDVYIQRREGESCPDGSCGDLSKCLRCENYFQAARVRIHRPDGIPGPLRCTSDARELKKVLADMSKVIHNEYLSRLLQRLKNKQPDAAEWAETKQKLKDGKCLGSACSSCGTAIVTKSLGALSDGIRTDCGGSRHTNASDIITCSSCRQHLHDMEDAVSRIEKGTCISGRCGISFGCTKCRNRPELEVTLSGPVPRQDRAGISQKKPEVESLCLDEDCTGADTCGACEYEKGMEKKKKAERRRDDIHARRFERRGQCNGPDPDLPYGLGCRYFDCNRCRMIEAKIGPKERNDELRRRRVENTKTSLNQSSDGEKVGNKRKRRFSNLHLHYPLYSDHPLAKRICEEKRRELLERQQADSRNERPSWFGTPEDPLPDRWMGRPVLSKGEIDILKVRESIPKYYLSESEEYNIALARDAETKKFCTIILRLEAELISRDFWIQSLGYEADDGHGNWLAGDYAVEKLRSDSGTDMEKTRVENWLSTVPRS
jgi:hypothetical protein